MFNQDEKGIWYIGVDKNTDEGLIMAQDQDTGAVYISAWSDPHYGITLDTLDDIYHFGNILEQMFHRMFDIHGGQQGTVG